MQRVGLTIATSLVCTIAGSGASGTNAHLPRGAVAPQNDTTDIEVAAAPSAPVNACTFLREIEITTVLGVRVAPGVRDDSGQLSSGPYATPGTYSSTCFWKVSQAAGGPAAYAILNVMQWPAGHGDAHRFLQSFWDAARKGDIDRTPVPLRIADESLWWGDGVAVRKGGDLSFGISVHLPGRRQQERRMEEALARKIVSRL